MIRRVERLKAELDALPLRELEILDGREIQGPNRRTSQNVAPNVSELSGCQIREGCNVEPLIRALLIRRQIRVESGGIEPVLVSLNDLACGVPAGVQVQRAAALDCEDSAGLPAAHDLVDESAPIEKALAFSKRQVVDQRSHEA